MRNCFFGLIMFCGSAVSAATYVHDFGTIKEDGGVVSHRFVLAPAKSSFSITSVRAGCRCITTDYPRQTIRPGQSVGIDLKYDPAGQNRYFRREAYVRRSDGGRDTLIVTGTVKMTRKLVDKVKFARDLGIGLRMRQEGVDLGRLRAGTSKEVEIEFFNDYQVGMQLDVKACGPDASMITVPAGAIVAPMSGLKFRIVVDVPAAARPGRIDAWLQPVSNSQATDSIPLRGVVVR